VVVAVGAHPTRPGRASTPSPFRPRPSTGPAIQRYAELAETTPATVDAEVLAPVRQSLAQGLLVATIVNRASVETFESTRPDT
jgi:hypothetical protein